MLLDLESEMTVDVDDAAGSVVSEVVTAEAWRDNDCPSLWFVASLG